MATNTLLVRATAPTATPTPAPNANNTTWLIVFTLLLLVLAYFSIKFAFGWKRSLKKTKNVLGKELVKPYVQGFGTKSSSFFTYLMINVFAVVILISTTIVLVKLINRNQPSQPSNSSYIISYYAIIITTAIVSLIFNFFLLATYSLTYKDQQYSHWKNLEDELKSIKNAKELTNTFPDEIKLDLNKMVSDNPLAPRVLARFIKQYNDLSKTTPLKARYNTYLDQKFKILYFNELNNQIEVEKDNESRMLGISNPENAQLAPKNKIEEEIIWMDKADAKAKIMMETKELVKNDNPKERNDNYEEYLYNIRANDPIYANVKRNSFVTYRDMDIEDLFYNPSTNVIYSIDGGKTTLEKPLNEFINIYHKYLIEKFYSTL